jgi:hypothetical protein
MSPSPNWKLVIHGDNTQWPESDKKIALHSGIYRGPKYGLEAETSVAAADLLLVIMDFEEESRRRVTTSFPSKFLDYCTYGKPIIIWAPEYASISQFCKQNQLGLLVNDPSPQALCEAVEHLISDPPKIQHLCQQSLQWASEDFNADHIHARCMEMINSTINTFYNSK